MPRPGGVCICGSGGPDWLRNDYEFVVCCTRGGRLPWSQNTAFGHPPKWAPGGEMSYRNVNGERVNDPWGYSKGKGGGNRLVNGKRRCPPLLERGKGKPHTKAKANGDEYQTYVPPVLANPGNVIHCKVGGGQMGSKLAHENEAPYPLSLAEFFVRSFCPPGGVVADCFSGSGTTLHAAVLHGRRFVGCDVRPSQVDLSLRRAAGVTPLLFSAPAGALA